MSESYKKLDARGRRALEKLDANTEVEIFMRLDATPDSKQLNALQATGCRVSFAAGNILTARVAASQLTELAELPFVQSLQLSRELFEEGG